MDHGKVNPSMKLEDQGITGLGYVYYNRSEAELQEAGKSIAELAAEEEAAAEFEIQELFDDIGAAASEDDELAESAGVEVAEEAPAEETEGD